MQTFLLGYNFRDYKEFLDGSRLSRRRKSMVMVKDLYTVHVTILSLG